MHGRVMSWHNCRKLLPIPDSYTRMRPFVTTLCCVRNPRFSGNLGCDPRTLGPAGSNHLMAGHIQANIDAPIAEARDIRRAYAAARQNPSYWHRGGNVQGAKHVIRTPWFPLIV